MTDPLFPGGQEKVKLVHEISEKKDAFSLRVMDGQKEVFHDIFVYLDNRKAFEMAGEIAGKLGIEDDGGVWMVKQVLRMWDEFARVKVETEGFHW